MTEAVSPTPIVEQEGAAFQWSALLVLGLIVVGFLVIQGLWIAQNQTILGNDAGAHLVRSIEVVKALKTPGREAIKTIWEVSEHRPPFSYVFTVPFYWLLGENYDAALWSNTFWLLLTGIAVYLFVRRIGTEWEAVWSTALTLTIPLLFQLGRLYYQETLVTLLVWLGFLVLLYSYSFARKAWSLAFGVIMGLALLVKWTIPALLAGAVLWIAWKYRRDWKRVPRMTVQDWGIAALGGVILGAATTWLLAPTLHTAIWGFAAAWVVLYALLIALWRASGTRTGNVLLSGVTAAVVASWWYFPELQFAGLFSDLVFGDAGRPDDMGAFSWLSYFDINTWLFYIKAFAFEQGGLFFLLVFLISLWGVRRYKSIQDGVAYIGWSLFIAWLIFTLSPFRDHARSIAPLLPAVGILTVLGLRRLGRSDRKEKATPSDTVPGTIKSSQIGFGAVILGALIVWQIAQFLLISMPSGLPVARSLQTAGLVVQGAYQYYPDSEVSSSAYHVAPQVLDYLEQHVDADGRVSLAMLINETQLHQNTLRAEFEMLAPGVVRVIPLTKDEPNPYAEAFNAPFVLYKTGISNDLSPEADAALQRILNEPRGLFAAAYETVWSQLLPNNEEIRLAQRRHALIPDSVRDTYQPIVDLLTPLLSPEDRLVIDNPAQVNVLGALGLPPIRVVIDNERELTVEALQPGQRLFAILWQPQETTESTLNALAVRGEAWQFGDIQVIGYVMPNAEGVAETIFDMGQLGNEHLGSVTFDDHYPVPGSGTIVTLSWDLLEGATDSDQLRTVLELYNADGTFLAKRDLPPDPAFTVGAPVQQQAALLLPTTLGNAPYCLLIARYNPTTGERLLTPTGEDHLQLCQ